MRVLRDVTDLQQAAVLLQVVEHRLQQPAAHPFEGDVHALRGDLGQGLAQVPRLVVDDVVTPGQGQG